MAHATSTGNKAVRPQAAARSKTKIRNQNAANVAVKSPVRSWRRRLPLASNDQIEIIEKYFAPDELKSRRFEADYDEFLPRELSATAHGWDGREVGFAFCFGESRCSGEWEYYRFVPPTRLVDFSLIPSGGKSAEQALRRPLTRAIQPWPEKESPRLQGAGFNLRSRDFAKSGNWCIRHSRRQTIRPGVRGAKPCNLHTSPNRCSRVIFSMQANIFGLCCYFTN